MRHIRWILIPILAAGMLFGPLNSAQATPPLPSSFYGEIHFVTGDGVPNVDDYVEAYGPDVAAYVTRAAITDQSGTLVYAINVPGDDPETTLIKEGGVEDDVVTFKINGRVVATGVWHSGTNVELNIHPPAANAGGPYVGVINEVINFSASATDWLITDTFNYAWDLDNDGAYDDSSDQNPTQSFSAAGIHTVGLKVTDSQGGEGTATTDVVVVELTGLTGQTYDSTQKSVTVSGNIVPYTYTITYNGLETAPTDAGSYTVVVTIKNGEIVVGTITKTMVIDKASQTITVTTHAPATAVFGSSFTVAATASSGLTVSYSSGSPSVCTVSGATFTMISGIGTCVVQYDQAGDSNYNAATRVTENVSAQFATHAITLVPGWNLVSFNLIPVDPAPASVLDSIAGKYDLVYAWDATGGHSGSGNWLRHDNTPASPDTLTSLTENMGFWIHITDLAGATLTVSGSIPSTTNISLLNDVGGWNLVGYPSASSLAMPGALVDHGVPADNYTLVYAYHAADTSDPWKLYDKTAPSWANDLTELAPGWGYWIFVNTDSTWHVEH